MPQDKDALAIDAMRAEIDGIDSELLALFNRRAECALTIGRIKQQNGQPIHVPERERAVLARLEGCNRGPLSNAAIGRIFRQLMEEMKHLEHQVATQK